MGLTNDRVVLAYELGYRVDSDGRLISKTGRFLKGSVRDKKKLPYLWFSYQPCPGASTVSVPIHKLAAYQKYGVAMFENGIQVRHLNSDPRDNSANNISIGTASENAMDRPSELRKKMALYATSFVRKYNKSEVKEYYRLNGFRATMDHFGISSKGTMSYIINH